jgi:outer membrane receptor protein involved in Fe transport
MAGSLFWVDWNGIQANVPLPSCGFGYNANLGKAASRGFDFQLDAKPIHGLTLSAAFGYTKATYRTDTFGAVPDGSDSAVLLARKGDDLERRTGNHRSAVNMRATLPRIPRPISTA